MFSNFVKKSACRRPLLQMYRFCKADPMKFWSEPYKMVKSVNFPTFAKNHHLFMKIDPNLYFDHKN